MDVSKIPAIRQCIEISGTQDLSSLQLTPIKAQLGESYSYGEIRLVVAHLKNSKQIMM
jgi:hypothetical protein